MRFKFKCDDILDIFVLPKNTKVVLYGAGIIAEWSIDIINYYRTDIQIVDVVDDHKSGCIRNFTIRRIENVALDEDTLIIISAPKYHFAIEQKLIDIDPHPNTISFKNRGFFC